MAVYNGNNKIKNVSDLRKVYVGDQLVFERHLLSISISDYNTELDRTSPFVFGGHVYATFDSGAVIDMASKATYTGYDMSVAGTYTVTVTYSEGGVTKTQSYQLTVNKIYETIFGGTPKSAGWDSNGDPQGDGYLVDTRTVPKAVVIPERGTQQLRITWTYNAFGGYHYTGTEADIRSAVPRSGYWHYGNDIHYLYERVNGSWQDTEWFDTWRTTHQPNSGAWNDTSGSIVDEITVNLSNTPDGSMCPIFGNMNAEGKKGGILPSDTNQYCSSNGVSLTFEPSSGKFYLKPIYVSVNDYISYTSTVSNLYTVAGPLAVANVGLTIKKIEIKR